MNQEQILSIVRQVMLGVGGIFVGKGLVDSATMTTIVSALVMLVGAGWAIYSRRNTGLVASAAAVPSVSQIVTTDGKMAAALNVKVVTP